MPPKPRATKTAKSKAAKQTALKTEPELPPKELSSKELPPLLPHADEPLDLTNIEQLVEIVGTKQGVLRLLKILADLSESLASYKKQVQQQLEADHALIEELSSQLAAKQQEVQDLQQKMDAANRAATTTVPAYESPIRKKAKFPTPSPSSSRTFTAETSDISDPVAREFEYITMCMDMLDVMTGLRVRNFAEDDGKFMFEIHHDSSDAKDPAFVDYVLIINKAADRNADVCYVPTFMEHVETGSAAESNNACYLRETLPDYFCETLTFPYYTLPQFYARMTRAMNRKR